MGEKFLNNLISKLFSKKFHQFFPLFSKVDCTGKSQSRQNLPLLGYAPLYADRTHKVTAFRCTWIWAPRPSPKQKKGSLSAYNEEHKIATNRREQKGQQ